MSDALIAHSCSSASVCAGVRDILASVVGDMLVDEVNDVQHSNCWNAISRKQIALSY